MFTSKAVAGLVVLFGLSVASASRGDDARPIGFSAVVKDFGSPGQAALPMRNYRWVPGSVIPTGLLGWTCKLGAIETSTFPASAAYHTAAVTSQSAALVCESAAGTVTATALCVFKSEAQSDLADINIRDKAGRSVSVTARCSTYTDAESDAIVRGR